MSNIDKLYLGTWQFADVDRSTAIKLIETAEANGIHKFDTARVYAGGEAEHLLGSYCTNKATIITKLPATSKLADTISEAYPVDYAATQIESSIAALGRLPDSILLHNWNSKWEEDSSCDIVASLKKQIGSYGIKRFGISLPNGYQGQIESTSYLSYLDDIELPFNAVTPSISSERISNLSLRANTLVRSLFMHGKDKSNIPNKIANALATDAYVVIGATKPKQIEEWKEMVQRYE